MKFHALLPVRDEADIIDQSLRHLLGWADAIYVFDTGSVDETWEIVQEHASRDARVIPLRKDSIYFSDTLLRGWIFHQARQKMRNGDWFLRVDADEFHHIPPPEFVRTYLRPHETIAWHQYYNFHLTESERIAWESGAESRSDRSRPIEERRRWFTCGPYSEPRLCRYRDTMRWPATASFPYNAGYVARERLPIRHYPHRDPDQMNRRCLLRAIMTADHDFKLKMLPEDSHWKEQEWRKLVVPDGLTGLQKWEVGTNLPEFHYTTHLAPWPKRGVQRLTHAFGLPLLDRSRPDWSEKSYPQRIPEWVQQELLEKLSESA